MMRGMARETTGVVLAGGLGTRMEGPKATAELAGEPLISYPVAAIEAAGLAPVVVAKPGSELPELSCPVLLEPEEPLHPLLGIVTALRRTGSPSVVVACDLPFVAPALLAELARAEEPLVVCRGEGPLQPLLGRYAPALADGLEEAVASGTAARDAVTALGARILGAAELSNFGPPERLLFNVNDRDDLARASTLMKSG